MTVKSRRQENTAATRQAVLQAALDLFVDRGFARTSIDDVARAARVSKGAVYHHFDDKAQLFEAVFRTEQLRLVADVANASTRHRGAWNQMSAAVDCFIDGCVRDQRHRVLLQEAPAALGLERCRAIDQELGLPAIRAFLDALVVENEIEPQPLEMLTRVIFSAVCEAAMSAGVDEASTERRDEAIRAVHALLGGLRHRYRAGGDLGEESQ